MNATRFFAGSLVALTAALSSACGSGGSQAAATETATETVAVPPPAVPTLQAVPMYPAVTPVNGVTQPTANSAECESTTTPVHLSGSGNGVDIGKTRVVIDTSYEVGGNTKETYTFEGTAPNVKGAYVSMYRINSTEPYSDSQIDIPAVWKPGMEKAFSVDENDFNLLFDVWAVILCVVPAS